jgi:hypothetical protein
LRKVREAEHRTLDPKRWSAPRRADVDKHVLGTVPVRQHHRSSERFAGVPPRGTLPPIDGLELAIRDREDVVMLNLSRI